MLKGLLMAVMLFACAGAGRVLSNGRKRRAELLSELLAALRVLRLRMLNSMEPIGILLRKSEAALLRDLGNSLREGARLEQCWQDLRGEYVKRGKLLDCLTEEDLQLLDSFFHSLGGSGREEQNELFSQIIARLEEAHSQARRSFAEAARTCTALGVLAGVGLCIIFV